jgi:CheY-like chemotaxis protein/MinD-like ATPase involved in chromosome partitioning or flagellar assembly
MAEKILIVDDDVETLKMVGLLLERQGYTISVARQGQQALSMARSEKPDLILLDLMMPEVDGLSVARQLRADPETQHMLIIMFTAKGQMEEKLEGFEAGADAYLTKPTQPRELVAQIKAVLKRASTPRPVSEPEMRDRGFTIGVLATRGGVGVSTLVINLAVALGDRSKNSVVVADFRPGCGAIGLDLGLSNTQGMSRLLGLNPAMITAQAVQNELTPYATNVRFLLASAQPQDSHYFNAVESFDALADKLSYLGRYLILDLGVSLTPVNEKVLERCQQVILVLEPVAQTLVQSRMLYRHLLDKGFKESQFLFALVNRLRAGIQLSIGQVQDELGHNVSIIFTAAPELAYQAQVNHTPMIVRQSDGVSAQQFTNLAQKVMQLAR